MKQLTECQTLPFLSPDQTITDVTQCGDFVPMFYLNDSEWPEMDLKTTPPPPGKKIYTFFEGFPKSREEVLYIFEIVFVTF